MLEFLRVLGLGADTPALPDSDARLDLPAPTPPAPPHLKATLRGAVDLDLDTRRLACQSWTGVLSFRLDDDNLADQAGVPDFQLRTDVPGEGDAKLVFWTEGQTFECPVERASLEAAAEAGRLELDVELTAEGGQALTCELAVTDARGPGPLDDATRAALVTFLRAHSGLEPAPETYVEDRDRYPWPCVTLPEASAYLLVPRLRAHLGPGWTAFSTDGQEGRQVLVAPGVHRFDPVRLVELDAVNYQITTEGIVETLESFDAQCGLQLLHVGYDTVVARLSRAPEDSDAFLRAVDEFCPDLLEQSVSERALRRQLFTDKVMSLWWD